MRVRLAVGLALVVLVTAILAGAVVTSAAITVELTDGDACETGGASDGRTEATPENVTTVAGNLTECIVGGEDDDVTAGSPPSGPG